MGVYDTKTQKVIFEPQFEDIYFLDNGLIRVEVLDETLGHTIVKIIDREGKEKFHSEYDSIYGALMSPYWETSIMEDVERKRGLIDDEGNVVVPCLYEDISGSKELLSKKKFIFQQGKKKGICRFDGTVEIQPIYDEISDCNHDMYITKAKCEDDSLYYGLITDTGEEVLPTIYHRLSWGAEDILILSDENGSTVAQYIEKK
jgi:hypothetical protein